jgi:hypothetical protein
VEKDSKRREEEEGADMFVKVIKFCSFQIIERLFIETAWRR